jgi:hypothetical protein
LWPRAVRYHTTAGGPLTSSGSGGDDGGGGGDDGGGSSGGGGGGDGSDGGGGVAKKASPRMTKKFGIEVLAHDDDHGGNVDDGGGDGDDGGGGNGGGGGGDGSDGGGGDAEKARPSTTKKYGIAALAHAHAMPSPIAAANEADAAGAARPVEEERAADEVRGPRVPSPRGRRRIVRRTIRCSTLAAR